MKAEDPATAVSEQRLITDAGETNKEGSRPHSYNGYGVNNEGREQTPLTTTSATASNSPNQAG